VRNNAAQVEDPAPEPKGEGLDVEQAFRDHAGFVGRVIQRLVGHGPHVDDILQETFIVAHRKRAEYDGRAAPSTWLYGIAKRLCMRYGRGNRRFRVFQGKLAQEDHGAPTRPDEELEREQAVAAVHDVLARLSFKRREVFVLYELEQLTGAEIAELLGVPEGTVWTRLHQARKSFDQLMKKRMKREQSHG
jgi:RNA polymerase sigma-70 factor (ECF subfamily)